MAGYVVETRTAWAHPQAVMPNARTPLTAMLPSLRSPLGAQIIEDIDILDGTPMIAGSRIPAATILAYLRDGYPRLEIERDYPTLPSGGIEAVEAWAERRFGPHWKNRASSRS